MRYRNPIGYRAALRWLVDNDDTEWTHEANSSLSVTASLVADIYGRTDETVRVDLIKLKAKREE